MPERVGTVVTIIEALGAGKGTKEDFAQKLGLSKAPPYPRSATQDCRYSAARIDETTLVVVKLCDRRVDPSQRKQMAPAARNAGGRGAGIPCRAFKKYRLNVVEIGTTQMNAVSSMLRIWPRSP
jgi:hypothetical protein